MIRVRSFLGMWAGITLLAVSAGAAERAVRAEGTETGHARTHRVELASGTRSVTLVQNFVPTAIGFEVHLVTEGPSTGTKTAAIMRANGEVEFPGGANDPAWWSAFFSGNGIDAKANVIVRKQGGRKLADIYVSGGGNTHVVGTAMFDPDNPWGPCPGPDDAPMCRPEPLVIEILCKWDVDQCSGGPLPWPPGTLAQDPDGEPAVSLDPDGDPARALGVRHLSLDATLDGTSLGTTILAVDGGRWMDFRP